ncbi:vacuolar protein sorting-associated protein 9 [Phakopsora pachyrhizi]|uniref:Vacuolar protein sorting-associated protein 9 n=1 Tax=Phakopsora pachyrhizi TaxID=170000 RepID=A0AAV0AL34_PHAPC|nr:vacuolar protein sorting-associated protein 9 [Phakopsora pachyrhizi]CAH7668067.1 vacuolar protein sorting-associated protein 9 [Phakopsora pachyrhizi]
MSENVSVNPHAHTLVISDFDPFSSSSTAQDPSQQSSSVEVSKAVTQLSQNEANGTEILLDHDSKINNNPSDRPTDPQSSYESKTASNQSLATPEKTLSSALTATRARASSWSLFRRTPISNEHSHSLPTSPEPPAVAQLPAGEAPNSDSKNSQDSPLSAAFSLSSIASAFKRPQSLAMTPSRLGTIPSQPQSPNETRPTPDLSPRNADPDPPPSVPPRLVMDDNLADDEPTAGPFDFNLFLEQMRWPQAVPIAKYLRSFLKEFTKRSHDFGKPIGVSEQVKVINDFLDFISVKMREIKGGPWDIKICNDAEFDHAVEAMEKLVMNRVWNLTFTPELPESLPSQTDDLERDIVLSQKMNLFYWVADRHLDMNLPPDEADGFLEFAKTELLKINSYKAPRDKMICILNCCKVIFGLIRHINQNEGDADSFVPILILVVLRAQPKNLISNVQYIQRFRNPEKMRGENGYYLSSLNAAISFIERLEHSMLSNISKSEFEYNVEQAISRLPRSPVDTKSLKDRETEAPNKSTQSTSIPDLTRSWLFSTVPQLAEKAVSRPLNAIARIVDDISSDSNEYSHEPDQSINRRPSLQETRRASASGIDYQMPHQPRRPGSRSWSTGSPVSIVNELESKAREALEPSDQDFRRIDNLKRAEHQAKLETLSSIFPKLETEVLEIVLITHHGKISKAIDSLLEMS